MKSNINKQEVINKLEENRDKIREFGINKIGLFGSILKGKQKRGSDVDILVEFNNLTFNNYADALILLEKIFKKKVDLVIESGLRPELEYVKKEVEYARI